MVVCITSKGTGLNSEIDPRFGRAQCFILYNTETKDFEAVNNENIEGASGVGVLTSQFMVDCNVELVCTGHVGPKAANVLNSAGIKYKEGSEGSVQDTINSL